MVTKIGLYKCGKQWRVRWYGKYDPKTGKQKRYSKTFDRKTDAEQFREEKKKEFGQGVKRDPSNESLKDYCERWLRHREQIGGIRPATAILYRGTFDRLYEYFGPDLLLRQIDRRAVKDFLASLTPKQNTESLSGWSKHRILRQCKTLFAEAVRDGIIAVNPFLEQDEPECIPSEWYYLRPDEFHKVLFVTPSLREKVLYALAYTAGLRKTELISLYWTDIDFDRAVVRIANRKATADYPPFYVKNKKNRDIPLPEFTVTLLKQLREQSPASVPFVLMTSQRCQTIREKWQQCKAQGGQWQDKNWENNTLRAFQTRVKQAGIDAGGKKLTLHVLRKCCIQNWANELPMNVAKKLAGHSSIETTAKFYSTVDDMHLKAAAKASNKLLATDHKLTFSAAG